MGQCVPTLLVAHEFMDQNIHLGKREREEAHWDREDTPICSDSDVSLQTDVNVAI